jgi:ABC-type transport system substrate-binding protein
LDSKVRGIYYNSPSLDALMVQQRSNTNAPARLLQLQDISKAVQDAAPWIFAYEDASIYGYKAGLKITVRPDEYVNVYAMSW